MLANVKQKTIKPLIQKTIAEGSLIYTDEYDIYDRLKEWGYGHKTVCHGKGEYARDEDGDKFHEVHVNTMEGVGRNFFVGCVLYRRISQEELPKHLGFFEFVHHTRARGNSLLEMMLRTFLLPHRIPT